MLPVKEEDVKARIMNAIDTYVGLQSWFYAEQVRPYLSAIADAVIADLKKSGVGFHKLEPPAKK